MIDSGAQGNFISPRTKRKAAEDCYELSTVEGEQVQYGGGRIAIETAQLPLQIHGRNERLNFDITEIGDKYDVILGRPWLYDITKKQPRNGASNEPLKTPEAKRFLAYLRIKDANARTLSATDIGKEDRLLSIPEEYRQYQKLFAEELETGLPEHSNYDHEIPLKEGKEPKLEAIYGLNQKEMEALDAYLEENLQKGYIRPSTSPAGYPILFWFTALDLKGAYNLIRMKSGEEWKTAFRTRRGHYEYLVMPFGLTNAPATFQTMINHVLREYLDMFVVVYLDDILIFSKTLEDHKKHVHQVLRKLQDAKLLVEPEKSKFHTQEVEFLGFTIAPGILKMSKDKVAAEKEQDQAFNEIKRQVTSEPILIIPNPEKPFEVETDSSDYAIGGQLGQRDDEGRLHPCAFFSRKLHGPELNYQIHDKELIAIIEAFKEWRPQLSGTKYEVKVYTDHKNLAHFTTSKDLNKRQIRWSEFLSEFNFRIIYRKGKENGRADALSRRPDHEVQVPKETRVILKTDKNGDLMPAARLLMMARRDSTSTPGRMSPEAIREIHSAPAHGHQGVTKTWKRIRQHYDKTATRQEVSLAIKDCKESISLDFVTKLPKSREPITNVYYDSVLVIVDRLTKYSYFIPYMESSTAEDLAYKFLQVIVSQHGMPKEIVSDRDKLFTSKFWRSLISQLGSDHKMSTAFHPQTDGQTERINQIMETYLRCYFAYNSAVGESTKESPFYLNYGFNPTAYGQPRQGPAALKAVADINRLKEIQQELPRDLEFVRERIRKYANKSRVEGPTLKEGDSVYLLRRNIKTKRPSDKLDFKKLGPFEITKKVSNVNFKLALPDSMKCHPVFHISLLESAPKGSYTTDYIEVDPEQEYEVERIIDHIEEQKSIRYLVKWKGYGHEDNTWEPPQSLENAQEELGRYWRQQEQEQQRQALVRIEKQTPKNQFRLRQPQPIIRPPRSNKPRDKHPLIRLGTPEPPKGTH
nr:reverse transcriptase domain protein [Colletotrichum truncatum]KAF6781651.1 reverse transcriptase domain protein [Colletotrichum truncatum]